MTARLLVTFAVLAAAANASDASQCAAIKTCYLGGDQSAPCVIAEGGCPRV
ncbi:hypothetical protein PR003_g20017 [Phytophthora rubi]|uniref:Uncharacterized protein n=1 Tax=Phytophthora rubi TaxID=129364 RepID=A0A6A3JXQ7_9STRA|nr:hypothetical protein PR001_g18880 [Phytophthora rubi]KAE9020967.1 hypothetical protein PR002_g12392 [Phytophthora rubi]KAE9311451.1 hypothetical protein PR003_g20017 [Phytophthora rubi]